MTKALVKDPLPTAAGVTERAGEQSRWNSHRAPGEALAAMLAAKAADGKRSLAARAQVRVPRPPPRRPWRHGARFVTPDVAKFQRCGARACPPLAQPSPACGQLLQRLVAVHPGPAVAS